MRLLASLALLAACGSEEGALLGFDGEQDITADRVEIVLASSKPADLTVIADPNAGYFRQRINIDEIEGVGSLRALTVRIEPDVLEAPEEAFIPFVFAFEDDALVAVATFAGADGKPAPISIEPGAVNKFMLALTPVAHVEAGAPLLPSTGTVFECAGRQAWRSGYAWQPPTGPQLRVLLPDPALDADMKSATMRTPDLDCDGYQAEADCDDLRTAIHPGAEEACDGVDSDCDGELLEVVSCTGANTCANESVTLCTDDGVSPPRACIADSSCACSAVSGMPCASCGFLHHTVGNEKEACAPAAGKLHTECTNCTVEVVDVKGPFAVTLAPTQDGPFASSALSNGYFYIRVEQTQPRTFPVLAQESIGVVYLAIRRQQSTELWPVDLQFAEAGKVDGECPTSSVGTTGDSELRCSP
ncbi:MAG: putative metal-binding motif-containing protein [Kofleriaceae bacterium]|nr:putative metal-binding motif-containing protein [Kofleriaceae bacterium]